MIKKILIALAIIFIIAGSALIVRSKYWIFTPAHSQRQTIQAFFNDISKSNEAAAYKLTTSNFQSHNTVSDFQSDFGSLQQQHVTVHFNSYLVSKGVASITGTITSSKIAIPVKFGMNVIKTSGSHKIETIAAVFSTN
jgi:hypothetical protein